MTAKTRADIQTEIDSLLANNTAGDISPTDVRTVHETSKDSNLNLLDTVAQTVAGEVNYSGDLKKSGKSIVPTTKSVTINVLADFPAPVAGVITLDADIFYLVGDDLAVSPDRWVLSMGTVVAGLDSSVSSMSYSGTGVMFTSVDNSNKITLLNLDCPNGTLHNITNPGAVTAVFQFVNCTVKSCDIVGTLDNLTAIQYSDIAFNDIKTDGITFAGTIPVFVGNTDLVTVNGASAILFDLGTAVFDTFAIDASFVTLAAGSTFISGLTNSGNISSGNTGSITGIKTFGTGTPLAGITVDDARWEFFANDDIANTRPDGLLSLQGNATNTVIASSGTPVLIAGTWVIERASQVTGTAAGRLTYNGGKNATLPMTGSVTIVPVSGGTIDISVEVAIDGTVIANSKRTDSASAGSPTSITIPWQDVFSTTGFVELFVTNEDSAVDLLVSSGILRLN